MRERCTYRATGCSRFAMMKGTQAPSSPFACPSRTRNMWAGWCMRGLTTSCPITIRCAAAWLKRQAQVRAYSLCFPVSALTCPGLCRQFRPTTWKRFWTGPRATPDLRPIRWEIVLPPLLKQRQRIAPVVGRSATSIGPSAACRQSWRCENTGGSGTNVWAPRRQTLS